MPLLVGQKSTSWLIEAKVSLLTSLPQPVTVKLSLPPAARDENIGQEAGSLGFGYVLDTTGPGVKAVWSAQQPAEGSHSLYFRVRFPERFRTGGSGIESLGPVPVASPPGLSGSVEKAARGIIARSRAASSDADTFFTHLLLQLSAESTAQENLLLRRHYEKVEHSRAEDLLVVMGIDLLEMAGIPARLAHGVKLDVREPQEAIPLIEYCDGRTWKVKNPAQPNVSLRSDNICVWKRGGGALLEVQGGDKSKVIFTVVKDMISLKQMQELNKELKDKNDIETGEQEQKEIDQLNARHNHADDEEAPQEGDESPPF